MKISLIICTYQRPEPLAKLLDSVKMQTRYPDEIIIVDGSRDTKTQEKVAVGTYQHLTYFLVSPEHRGLTRQRNFGISKLAPDSDIVSFLDDDTVLQEDYFENLLLGYKEVPEAAGIGGVSLNENRWIKNDGTKTLSTIKYYQFDGYYIKESARNQVRNVFGLQSNLPPGKMPDFSHGRTYSYPLNSKRYAVDLLVGMSMSFRKKHLDNTKFSKYFEGYGLYEDADFSLRMRQFGPLYIDTNVQLNHYHAPDGRPNKFAYGKMVIRNGWYVWRVGHPNAGLKARLKWNATAALLTAIRFTNALRGSDKKAAFTEALGRVAGWWSLVFSKPRHL